MTSDNTRRAWTDNDDILTAEWLQEQGIFLGSREAHEAVGTVARENRIPIALVRASISGVKLTAELPAGWRFYTPPRPADGAAP